MRTEVTLLRRVIFRVDEDCVVWTRGHARLATDTDGLIKINDTVCALEHCSGRTSCHTRSMSALIAACHLMSSASLWKTPDVNVFDVGTCHADWHNVLRLTRGSARMTPDAAGVVNDLRPLHAIRAGGRF